MENNKNYCWNVYYFENWNYKKKITEQYRNINIYIYILYIIYIYSCIQPYGWFYGWTLFSVYIYIPILFIINTAADCSLLRETYDTLFKLLLRRVLRYKYFSREGSHHFLRTKQMNVQVNIGVDLPKCQSSQYNSSRRVIYFKEIENRCLINVP
jgi:hypothetical protein